PAAHHERHEVPGKLCLLVGKVGCGRSITAHLAILHVIHDADNLSNLLAAEGEVDLVPKRRVPMHVFIDELLVDYDDQRRCAGILRTKGASEPYVDSQGVKIIRAHDVAINGYSFWFGCITENVALGAAASLSDRVAIGKADRLHSRQPLQTQLHFKIELVKWISFVAIQSWTHGEEQKVPPVKT